MSILGSARVSVCGPVEGARADHGGGQSMNSNKGTRSTLANGKWHVAEPSEQGVSSLLALEGRCSWSACLPS